MFIEEMVKGFTCKDLDEMFDKIENDYNSKEVSEFYTGLAMVSLGVFIRAYDVSDREDEAIDFLKLTVRYAEFAKKF